MMTSSQVRQSFLDFFKSKQHAIVPSSSLMPNSPNLLFTNAGMNQFVPIFLGQTKCPYTPGRVADTQKCIRAGGKHNDLEDVGLDTYHHTFFEMLGNWSFGDYFKKEAIEWAWELVVEKWKFPPTRLYATVYSPDKSKNDPSEFDQEAWNCWAEKFRAVGLDPEIHIVHGNKKDNFWMMGETGPCGPCSELHVDLTPQATPKARWSTRATPAASKSGISFSSSSTRIPMAHSRRCPPGTWTPAWVSSASPASFKARKTLTDFANAKISNYETDIFRPIFDALEKLSGKKYGSTLPVVAQASCLCVEAGKETHRQDACATTEQIALDIAFRVIADHIRTLGFAIADGIQPGNNDRNYVLRRILRRAVRYGRTLGFHEPFFYKLVDVLADTMGDVFPEIRARKKQVQETIRTEEEAFNKTLDNGIKRFDSTFFDLVHEAFRVCQASDDSNDAYHLIYKDLKSIEGTTGSVTKDIIDLSRDFWPKLHKFGIRKITFPSKIAFELYDTYGFPLDLTELMARERGLTVDKDGFEKLMEEQRARARAAQKKEVISLSQIETTTPTKFVGYENLRRPAKVLEVVSLKDKTAVILDTSACYAEMGGQVGDTGEILLNSVAADVSRLTSSVGADSRPLLRVTNTQKSGNTWLHFVAGENIPAIGDEVVLRVDQYRRNSIQRHHTVTHLLHWALHEVASKEASQKGSFVGPDKLTFDFNSAPLTPQQVADIEKLVNERILENAGVSWTEVSLRRREIAQGRDAILRR